MAWTTTDLQNIETAIAEGVTTVSVNGRTITYRSLSDMERIRDRIRHSLGLVSNGGITYQTPKHSKGLCS